MLYQCYAKPARRSIKPTVKKDADENRPDNDSPEDDVMLEDVESKDRRQCLFDDDKDVAGKSLFGFHTPKKRNAMGQLAENTPRTPTIDMRALSLNSPQTPRVAERHLRTPLTNFKSMSLSSPRTPKSQPANLNTKTPQATRNRLQKATRKKMIESEEEEEEESCTDDNDSDFKNSEDESSESSDSSSAEQDSDVENRKASVNTDRRKKYEAKQTVIEAPGRRSTRIKKPAAVQEDFIPDSDNYFRSVSSKMVRSNIDIIYAH